MSFQPNVLSQLEKKAQFEAELLRYEEQADFLYKKQRLERIEYFSDQYEFLANEYPCPIFYEGLIYHSVYAAFQAARSGDEEMRQRIAASNTVLEVFQMAQHIEDPKDWSKQRLRVMEILLRDKFRRNNELRERLRDTNHYQLINTYNQQSASNVFWGVVDGKGQNQLGRLLEDIRMDIHNNEDLDKWLLMSFNVQKDKSLIPIIKFIVDKDEEHIETITLMEKIFYHFGQYGKNDVVLAHPSISRRHCVVFINNLYQVQLIDLGSRSGTFINDQMLEPHFPFTLCNDDKIKFAKSTRSYNVDINYEECQEYIVRRINQTEAKVKLLDKVQQGKASHEELKASLGLAVEDTVMVQNLPEKVSHFELKQLFSSRGKISELKIPLDRITGNTKNVAFIKYQNEKDAKWIVEHFKAHYKDVKLTLSLASNDRVDQFYEDLRWGLEMKGEVKKEHLRQETKKNKRSKSSSSKRTEDSSSRSRSRHRNKKGKDKRSRKDRHERKDKKDKRDKYQRDDKRDRKDEKKNDKNQAKTSNKQSGDKK